MLKSILIIVLISLFQSACGGARSSATQFSPDDNFVNVSSNSSISWHAPTEYTDATPISLSEIGGYHVYAGTSENSLSLIANIPSSTATTFSLSRLGKGIRYITVTCYDINGVESGFSTLLVLNIY